MNGRGGAVSGNSQNVKTPSAVASSPSIAKDRRSRRVCASIGARSTKG